MALHKERQVIRRIRTGSGSDWVEPRTRTRFRKWNLLPPKTQSLPLPVLIELLASPFLLSVQSHARPLSMTTAAFDTSDADFSGRV